MEAPNIGMTCGLKVADVPTLVKTLRDELHSALGTWSMHGVSATLGDTADLTSNDGALLRQAKDDVTHWLHSLPLLDGAWESTVNWIRAAARYADIDDIDIEDPDFTTAIRNIHESWLILFAHGDVVYAGLAHERTWDPHKKPLTTRESGTGENLGEPKPWSPMMIDTFEHCQKWLDDFLVKIGGSINTIWSLVEQARPDSDDDVGSSRRSNVTDASTVEDEKQKTLESVGQEYLYSLVETKKAGERVCALAKRFLARYGNDALGGAGAWKRYCSELTQGVTELAEKVDALKSPKAKLETAVRKTSGRTLEAKLSRWYHGHRPESVWIDLFGRAKEVKSRNKHLYNLPGVSKVKSGLPDELQRFIEAITRTAQLDSQLAGLLNIAPENVPSLSAKPASPIKKLFGLRTMRSAVKPEDQKPVDTSPRPTEPRPWDGAYPVSGLGKSGRKAAREKASSLHLPPVPRLDETDEERQERRNGQMSRKSVHTEISSSQGRKRRSRIAAGAPKPSSKLRISSKHPQTKAKVSKADARRAGVSPGDPHGRDTSKETPLLQEFIDGKIHEDGIP